MRDLGQKYKAKFYFHHTVQLIISPEKLMISGICTKNCISHDMNHSICTEDIHVDLSELWWQCVNRWFVYTVPAYQPIIAIETTISVNYEENTVFIVPFIFYIFIYECILQKRLSITTSLRNNTLIMRSIA